MRRILLLITDLETGGTPTVVRELAVRLHDPPGVRVEVACLSKWGPVADQLRNAGIEVTALNARSVRDIGAIARLMKLIAAHEIDTVLSFLIHANVAAAITKLVSRNVRFFQSIQTTQSWPRWHWKLQAIVQAAAEKILVPSTSVADAASGWSDVPREKLVVIPNAVDIDIFSAIPRQPIGETIDVGFLGRLDPVKRVPDLVAAMALLDPHYRLSIYGEGRERETIEREIDCRGVRDRIKMFGQVAKPQAVFGEMDLLVLPSEAEGFGLVLIEAMAARVPVVATNVAGIRDVVRNDVTGLLVPAANPPALAAAIRRIIEDERLRHRLIEAAFKDVCDRFSWTSVLTQYRRALEIP